MEPEVVAILIDKGITFAFGVFGTILGARSKLWQEGGSWHNMLGARWIFQVGGPCLIVSSVLLAIQDFSRL